MAHFGVASSITSDNNLTTSWYDSAWIPCLNKTNVMDYFAHEQNPFYNRQCNNEIIRMQRLNPEQLQLMTGVEFHLLHVQDPILFVIRKQLRHSPSQTTTLADYYIIAGKVYQAPDLSSIVNSRMLNGVNFLTSAFKEAQGFSKYHPSKGYWWEFKDDDLAKKKTPLTPKSKKKEEPSSVFQRQRVDELLQELTMKFPLRPVANTFELQSTGAENKPEVKIEIKTEMAEEKSSQQNDIGQAPPEKKGRFSL